MLFNFFHGLVFTVAAVGAVVQLTGCASSTTPVLDSRFGDAVRAAREAQTLNPTASANRNPVLGIDGKAAVNSLERYQDSFKTPPKSFEVINIGGALSTSP